MAIFDFLKRKPKSFAGPALPATDLTIEDVQRAAPSPPVAPSFAETKRAPLKISAMGSVSRPSSSQGSTVLTTKPPDPPKTPERADPFKDNFAEVQGLIDEQTLASGSVPRIVEAVKAAQRTIAEEKYNPIDEKSSWFQRFWEPTKQAIQTPGETLITQAQNIANLGLEPMGMVSRPLTRKGQLEALDRVLEKYAPEELVNSKLIRAMAGEQSGPMAAAEFTTNIGTAVVGSTAAINAFRSLPIAAKLKASGEAGIYATHFMENLIASAVASTPGSLGQKKPQDFGKLMITNGGFLFPTASYGGLAIATTASFLANTAMGQSAWEAAGNSVLGLAGAAVQRKEVLNDLFTYRKGAFSDALRSIIRAEIGDNIPQSVRDAAIDEAAQLRAYHEQNPQNLEGLYKMTLDSQKRLTKLYAEYKKASPTGEQRLIGRTGPMQSGPNGGFQEPSPPQQKRAPVDFNKPNKPDIEKLVTDFKAKGAEVYQLDVPVDKVKSIGEGRSAGLVAEPGDVLPPPVGFFDPATGQVQLVDGNRRMGYFESQGFDTIPVTIIDPKHALKDPAAIAAAGFKAPGVATTSLAEKAKSFSTAEDFVHAIRTGELTNNIDVKTEKVDPKQFLSKRALDEITTFGQSKGRDITLKFFREGRTTTDSVPLIIKSKTQGSYILDGAHRMSVAAEQGKMIDAKVLDIGDAKNVEDYFKNFYQTANSAFPSVFKGGQPAAGPSPIPVTPRITPVGRPETPAGPQEQTTVRTQPEPASEPQPGLIQQITKPLQPAEARRIAVDLFRQLDSEYSPEFVSKAEFGEEFAAAEQNAALAQELITNPQIRGVLQQVTGKQGYNALEKIELDNLGPFIQRLRGRVDNGSATAMALDNIQSRIRDDSNSEYGREVLNHLIAQARGDVKTQLKRPNAEQILAVIDRAIADGRLQMSDEAGNGRTIEQIYESLYNELAKNSDSNRLANALQESRKNIFSYGQQKMEKKAQRKELLGDVLRKEDAAKELSQQQIRDAASEANLSNRDLEALYKFDDAFAQALEEGRKMTQIEFNKTLAEARELPPEVSKKIIADMERLKAAGKIATPLEARLQKNKFLTKLLTQQKGMTRAAQREAVRAKKEANHEKMKSLYKTLPRMPIKIQKMMKSLHDSYRKSMPLDQQEQIVAQMKDLNEIGAQQNRVFREKREAADATLAQEVVRTAVRKVKNQDKRVRDRISPLLMNETPPNLVIMNMGEGAMNVFKRSMDDGMNEAWPLQRDWDKEVLAKAQEIGIKHDDMQSIVDYSLWNRGGKAGDLARARLSRMGVKEPKLNDKQMQFYEWQQKFLKMLAGKTKEVYEKENPLRELDISDPKYFPMKVVGNDFTVSKGPNTMSIDQVPDGFTKSIKGNESVDIYREPDALFRHINDVAHYVTLTEKMQQMRRILERPEVINALGNENVDYLQNRWLDLVARHGAYAEKVNEAMAMINAMGNRAYGGVLAGKAIVGLRQFGSIIDAMGPLLQKFGVGPAATYIGKVLKNAPALASEHLTELGKYIETNPDLQASVGITDMVMEQIKGGEFASRHTFLERHPKLNKFIFAVIRQPDLLGRATLAMHVEGLYRAQGMEQREAQRSAMEMVNNVFGSIRVHNRPTASGHANTRPLYLFGQTQRARQGMYRQAMKDWTKDPLGNSAVLGAYTLSSMILMYLGSLAIESAANREKAQKQAIQWGWLYAGIENTIPVIGSMISRTLQTGDASNAIPYLGMVMNALGSFRQVATGKKMETKIKGALRGTEQTLGAVGVPAPALRSNYNLIMNIYDELAGGKSPESLLDPEVKEQIETMKKDLRKELQNSDLQDMKKDLRRELQKLQ